MNTAKRKTEQKRNFFEPSVARSKSIVDLSYLNEVSGGNSSFINAMVQAFRDESYLFLRDMDRYLAKCDFLAVARSAHKMKPAGAYLGVNALTILVGNLEHAASSKNKQDADSLFIEVRKLINKILNEVSGYVVEA